MGTDASAVLRGGVSVLLRLFSFGKGAVALRPCGLYEGEEAVAGMAGIRHNAEDLAGALCLISALYREQRSTDDLLYCLHCPL